MKRFFSNKVRTVILLALILTVVLAVMSGALNINFPGLFVKGVLTPLRSGLNTLTGYAEQVYNYMFRYEALLAENEDLKERIAQMEDDARTADALLRENERLRQQMGLLTARNDFTTVDAYIISWDSTEWTDAFTINRGSGYGIEEGMCVITANGEVVGLIVEAGPNYAVIKTILDSSLEISGTIASTGHNGMVQGGYTEGRKDLLRMDYLPSSSIIRNKDQVVTSGSTVYPRNLIMGYVVDAGFDETGVAKFAMLEPAADIAALEQIFVITQYTVVVTDRPEEETEPAEVTEPVNDMGGVG